MSKSATVTVLLVLDTVFKCEQTLEALEGFMYSHECHHHNNDKRNVFMCRDSSINYAVPEKHI